MSRLIDADMLCLNLGEYFNHIRKIDKRRIKQIDAIGQDIYAEITNTPTVDAEPVRYGKWEIEECTNSIDGSLYKRYRCNKCGCPTAMFIRSPYCSNCGAKMDGE